MRTRIQQLERAARPLDPGPAGRRRLHGAVVASAERYLRRLDTQKAYEETATKAQGLLASPIAAAGIPVEDALDLFEREVVHPGSHPSAGTHLAFIPGGAIYHAALADYLAAVSNKYVGIFFTGPGPVRMENQMIRWVADLVGYPASAGGTIASGGSLANLTAITTARDAHALRGADYAKAVVYLTSQTHHCVDKALRIAGMAETRVHRVATDDRHRMQPAALAAAIAGDRARGLRPWLIVATAGATDTGAVDPLADIADVAQHEACWYHVDAAYGGFFLLTEHGRALLAGIERSDSAVLDPHKSLFLPWGAGILVVRDVRHLLATHGYTGNYMQDAQREPGEISPADVSPELTKPFRALRIWLPLKVLGTAPFQAALDEKLLLARYFHREIQVLGFIAGPPPDLSVVTFRWAPPGVSLDDANRRNQQIVDNLRRDGRVFLSSTELAGQFTLRMAAVAFRTHLRDIDLALRLLAEQAAALA